MNVLGHFRVQYEVLSYIGLTPLRLKDAENRKRKIFQRCSFVSYFGMYLTMVILSSHKRFEDSKHKITVSHTFVDVIETTVELLFVVTCLLLPIIRSKNWDTLFHIMDNLEKELIKETGTTAGTRGIICIYFPFVLLIIFDISWFLISTKEFHWYYGTLVMNKLYYSCLVYFMYTTNKIVSRFYEILTGNLKEITNGNQTEKKIQESQSNFSALYDLTTQFNLIFGWQIFLVTLTTILIVLNVVNDTLYLNKNESTIWKTQMFCDLDCAPVYVVRDKQIRIFLLSYEMKIRSSHCHSPRKSTV